MTTEGQDRRPQREQPTVEALQQEIETLRCRIAELEAARARDETSGYDQGHEKAHVPGQVREVDLLEMANTIRDVFWIFDWQKQRVIYASPAYEEIWGRSVRDLYECYEEWSDSLHPDDRETAQASFAQVVQTGGGELREYRVVRPDGSIRWISDRAYPVSGEDGRICRVVGVAEDVTEHKRVEEEVRAGQVRLRAAIESLPFEFFVLDENGRHVMQNSVSRQNWGDLIGKCPADLPLDEQPRTLWQDNRRRALAGEVVQGETVFEPHGVKGVYQYVISPIRDGDRVRGILGLSIDITARRRAEEALQEAKDELEHRVRERTAELEASNAHLEAEIDRRKQMERELRESEKKYRTLVESAGDAIATVSEDGVILFVNTTIARQFGVAPEAMIGKRMQDFFPESFAGVQVARIREVIDNGKGVNLTSPAQVGGQARWFNATFEPLELDGANAVLIIARDIDDLVQARKQLEEYREQMTRTDRLASLGTMSAMVAHELTQPLTVLRLSLQNALEALRTGSDASVVEEDLDGTIEEIVTIMEIIERFRGFARASSPGHQRDVDLSDIARHMVELTAEAAERAHVSVSLRGLDRLPRFSARPKDMEQLFFALLMNAIQAAAGRTERVVVVTGQARDQEVELRFEDNCGGIAAENVDRIFKPFFTTKADAGGTGLGLCVVKHILDRYNAEIEILNRLGEGVTFKVVLPLSSTASS